jgi:hypothetical protein
MVVSMAHHLAGVQPVFSSSLELAVHISNLFSDLLEGMFFPRPVVGNFLPFGKYDCKVAFIFDFGWMWMVIQSTCFPSTTSAYTIRKMVYADKRGVIDVLVHLDAPFLKNIPVAIVQVGLVRLAMIFVAV